MWIIIFILSCLPKLEKLVPMRNMLSEVWHCFFLWKRIPQLKRSLIHPGFPLFSQKSGVNMASLMWLLLPAIVFPWIPVQGRTETQPACCFPPLYNYPSKALALLTTRLSLLQPERRSCGEISRRWACRYSLGTPLAAATSLENPSSCQTPLEKALGAACPSHPLMPWRSSADHPSFPDSHAAI